MLTFGDHPFHLELESTVVHLGLLLLLMTISHTNLI